ncbi:MAG: L-serine ammonia-lyase, iron-sulfur-dependent, subunit alpha [Oscillospiraceae bacterium]|nr:L-serine ammonia-lyase, iron-sulfur-dependent, subunit alpha [Oscillospiraceae bacterium]
MHHLTALLRADMRPALGVTEPGAIAYAAAVARSHTRGEICSVDVAMNSGMYKNAFTCGIPNCSQVGTKYAAALGAVAGRAEKKLEALSDIRPEDNSAAELLIAAGKVRVSVSEVTSRIYICAEVCTARDIARVIIQDSHTNITRVEVNGTVLTESAAQTDAETSEVSADIRSNTLADLLAYAQSVDASELSFIREAFRVNLELFEEGRRDVRLTFLPYLLAENGGTVLSGDARKTASLLCGGAVEARVLGLSKPAMSITGSGAHGIIATLPLYAAASAEQCSEELLTRAAALSCLICTYIKEYSGRLSAFCGCAIAGGTGMACGLSLLHGGGVETMTRVINNLAAGITGMICDGGNQGCVMKSILAVDAAFRAEALARNGVCVDSVHGICGGTPEETMRNMGRIASPGMEGTEKTILEILQNKD